MQITFSETIDADPASNVDLSKLFIAQTTGDNHLALAGATVTATEALTITITLAEAQRVTALQASATDGGDGGAVVLDILADFVFDIGLQTNAAHMGVSVAETEDSIIPQISYANIDYNAGLLTIFATETLDVNPASKVDLSKIFVVNQASARDSCTTDGISATCGFALSGAAVTAQNGEHFNITLTEAQRVLSIAISGTAGGDTGAILLDFDASAYQDVGLNRNQAQTGVAVNEVADTTPPTATSVAINYGTGAVIIQTNEVVDITPITNLDLSKIYISQSDGDETIQLLGVHSSVSADATNIQVTLTEAQRIAALKISGTAGGDGAKVIFEIKAGAFKDIAQNVGFEGREREREGERGKEQDGQATAHTIPSQTEHTRTNAVWLGRERNCRHSDPSLHAGKLGPEQWPTYCKRQRDAGCDPNVPRPAEQDISS